MSQSRWWCSNTRPSEAASPRCPAAASSSHEGTSIRHPPIGVCRARNAMRQRPLCLPTAANTKFCIPGHSIIRPQHIGQPRSWDPIGSWKRRATTEHGRSMPARLVFIRRWRVHYCPHTNAQLTPAQPSLHAATLHWAHLKQTSRVQTHMNKKRKKLFKNLAIYFGCLNINECAAERACARSRRAPISIATARGDAQRSSSSSCRPDAAREGLPTGHGHAHAVRQLRCCNAARPANTLIRTSHSGVQQRLLGRS